MARRFSDRYYMGNAELVAIVSDAKKVLFAHKPELKVFETEIGSYISRAVQLRNEKGMRRLESYAADQAAQAEYKAELVKLASNEAKKCIRRFAGRLKESLAKQTAITAANTSADRYFDYSDDILVTQLA
jgi:hypothetical protein